MMHIYCYYNHVGGFFVSPFMNNCEPEQFAKDLHMGLFGLKEDVLNTLKECDLYYLGSFDNITGEFSTKKDFLLHVGEVVSDILAKKEVAKDGGHDKN